MRVAHPCTYSTENTLELRHSICSEKPDTSKILYLKPGSVGQNIASHASPAARISVCLHVTVSFISPVAFGYNTDTHVMRDFDQTFSLRFDELWLTIRLSRLTGRSVEGK